MSDQQLYSTKQAAKFLGVSVRTLKYWRKSGKLVPDSQEETSAKFGRRLVQKYSLEQLRLVQNSRYIRQTLVQNSEIGATFEIKGCKIGIKSETGVVERVQCSEIGIKKGATFQEEKQPQVVTSYTQNEQTAAKPSNETTTTAQSETADDSNRDKNVPQDGQQKKVTRQMVPQPIVTRLLNSGSTAEIITTNEENSSSVEVEEFYFDDDDDDIIIINDSFKATLPEEHRQNLTKLFGKLTVAPFGEIFATPFNREETLITYAKLDYANSGITFNGKFDETHELILNSLYSFYRAENILFTSRNILQHIFGNVPDHFQSELVEVIEQHLDELRCMRISMDLKDKFGNNAFIKLHGEKYRPIALDEDILDVSILEMKSVKNSKNIKVYRINRLSSIFKYAEKLMKVPVRKTIQNALLCSYLLVKISLVKNSKNKYKNNGILFTTIHEDLNLDVDNRNKVKNIRDNIRKMFDYWLKIGLIKSYQFEKRGTSFYKISFTVT